MSDSELTVDEITEEVEAELATKGAGEDAPAEALEATETTEAEEEDA